MNVETASKLVKYRKKIGLSQEQLAEKIGVSRQAVSKWERAESAPDTDNLIALSKIYNVTIDEMLNHQSEANINQPTDEPDAQQSTTQSKLKKMGLAPLFALSVIIYLVIGFLFQFWHPGWVIFLAVACLYFFKKISKRVQGKIKGWRLFPVPILVFVAFIILLVVFRWQWAWLVFLTIPIWACFYTK